MKQTDIYFLCGQGDAATSPGIVNLAEQYKKKCNSYLYYWHNWANVVAHVNSRAKLDINRLAVTYSMGANAITWILGGVQGYSGVTVPFDWVCFIDPTTLSVLTPLNDKLKKALHFHNTSVDPVGHAYLTSGKGFNYHNLEIVEVSMLHLMLDNDVNIQKRIMSELDAKTA